MLLLQLFLVLLILLVIIVVVVVALIVFIVGVHKRWRQSRNFFLYSSHYCCPKVEGYEYRHVEKVQLWALSDITGSRRKLFAPLQFADCFQHCVSCRLLLVCRSVVIQTRLYSFKFSCSIVSLTAANTNRIFSVSEINKATMPIYVNYVHHRIGN